MGHINLVEIKIIRNSDEERIIFMRDSKIKKLKKDEGILGELLNPKRGNFNKGTD